MKIKEAQDMIHRIYFERDKARGMSRTILRTFQELGELSDAILREKSVDAIIDEVGDVFAWICSIANLLEVDLGEALLKKYDNVCSKCGKSPCVCTDSP